MVFPVLLVMAYVLVTLFIVAFVGVMKPLSVTVPLAAVSSNSA